MRCEKTFSVWLLTVWVLAGCTFDKTGPIAFLGIPESETSGRGPVGLINGQPRRVDTVTAVTEATYEQYQSAKRAGRIFAQESHGDYVYYAIKQRCDIQFDNASTSVEVVERFKAKKP